MPRESRDTLFLLAVVAWVILPHAEHLPLWAPVLAATALGWRGWLAWHSRPLPSQRWRIGLLLLVMLGTWWSHKTLLGRDAGVTLVVALLTLKTLELRARRDAFVIFFLSFFTMLTHFFFSQSLPIAAAMLVGLLGLLTALINAHLPVGRPPLATSAGMALRMTLLGAPVMVLLFLFFPRMAPLWGLPSDALSGRSGLSTRMEIGKLNSLALDDSIALRVRFEQQPLQSELYFRGPVFQDFDGREWKPSTPEDLSGQVPRRSPPASLQVSGPALRYEVTLQPHNRPWLLALDVTPEAPKAPGTEAYITTELQWITQRPVNDLLRYQAVAYPSFRYGANTTGQQREAATRLPAGRNPRTLQLAMDMRRDPRWAQADALTLSAAVLQRLAQGGYVYTLEPGEYGEHTADEFWFDRKAGFCEHIASAYVVLMRALDVPARLVTGYQGGERNALDGYWVVRQSDAHAWAEIWQAGQGWVRVDPTGAVSPGRIGSLQRLQAPRGLVGSALGQVSPGLLQTLRSLWDAGNNRWNQWVLGYTQSRQFDLLRQLGFESPSWEDLIQVLGGGLGLSALASLAWVTWQRQRQDPWLRLMGQVHDGLKHQGLPVPAQAPPRTLARAVLAARGESGRPLHDWLLQLEALRYAAQAPQTRTTTQPAAPTLSALKRQLKPLLRSTTA
ncbi:transglutaminaseTgpA domain-containing protein [Curvibacter sp. HBC28]|uniref:TransglutaminaseTgpA domain-containing protein n=1 Tax=Curvibacter microcysteis TaxID=3026419 RepID=A0ABT5MM67_9BURK|nr:transglutaminaseTgpA domain-containing protein [Curvibacter sp. HBC28]MDD0816944.1 transglutaminaseTgpA domain-containing protein [Curvibacter sp. HBC28]